MVKSLTWPDPEQRDADVPSVGYLRELISTGWPQHGQRCTVSMPDFPAATMCARNCAGPPRRYATKNAAPHWQYRSCMTSLLCPCTGLAETKSGLVRMFVSVDICFALLNIQVKKIFSLFQSPLTTMHQCANKVACLPEHGADSPQSARLWAFSLSCR
jgi:hypothetical protein